MMGMLSIFNMMLNELDKKLEVIKGFSCMIYLIAAKLRLAYPNPLRQLE